MTLGEFGIVLLRKNVPVFFLLLQVVPILYTVHDRNILVELLKPELRSTTCTSGASRSRPPSSWRGVLAARKYAGVIHSDVLPNHCPPTNRKAQFTKPGTACRFLACMLSQPHLFAIVLPLCLMFFSHLGCMMSRRRFQDILPSTPCSRCRRLDSTIRAVLLSGVLSPHLGFTSACVAPLSPRFRNLLDDTVKTFAVFPSC